MPPGAAAISEAAGVVSKAILNLVTSIPATSETRSETPHVRAKAIGKRAAFKAAAISGTLALPIGPLGLITVVPDLIAVWRVQAQMVADISGAFGKTTLLGREEMIHCLFRHAAAQAVRGIGTRVGKTIVFHRVSLQMLDSLAKKLGVRMSERMLAGSVSRFIPVVGSVGVAGFAFYDTTRVASTAAELFESHVAA